MTFASLGLSEPLCKSLAAEGYEIPTPIQAGTIPHVLAGSDVLGCAQTGTGKTAAFSLPILHRLSEHRVEGKGRPIRALILSPTRELAAQIGASIRTYGKHTKLRHAEVYGGVNQRPQTRLLQQGVDILVATPGRLMDLMEQGYIDLSSVQTFVLDEADRMLDMGFIPDIRKIATKLPTQRQTLLFSATMPTNIRKLADSLLHEPEEVIVADASNPGERIEQSVYHLTQANKSVMLEHVLRTASISRVLVFTRTKHGADKITKQLNKLGLHAAAIHGNKTQANRKRTLDNFRSGRTSILIATDVAARGIDVDDVSHVINFDLPKESETYVHRIGRTARAGATGTAIAFCAPDERGSLKAIERLMKQSMVVGEHELSLPPAPMHDPAERTGGRKRGPRGSKAPGKRRANANGNQSANQANSKRGEQSSSPNKKRRRYRPAGPAGTGAGKPQNQG